MPWRRIVGGVPDIYTLCNTAHQSHFSYKDSGTFLHIGCANNYRALKPTKNAALILLKHTSTCHCFEPFNKLLPAQRHQAALHNKAPDENITHAAIYLCTLRLVPPRNLLYKFIEKMSVCLSLNLDAQYLWWGVRGWEVEAGAGVSAVTMRGHEPTAPPCTHQYFLISRVLGKTKPTASIYFSGLVQILRPIRHCLLAQFGLKFQ